MAKFPTWCLLALFALSSGGCTLPRMQVDPALSSRSAALPVNGRNGWLVDQELSFGDYRSGPVSRGWTKGYDYPFLLRFSGAREKLRFPVRNASGGEAMVHCMGKLREIDLRAFRDYFDVNVSTTDSFAGTVTLEGAAYDFHVENLNVQQGTGYRPLEGALDTPTGPVRIQAVWKLESGQPWLGTRPVGIEFLRGGVVVGAVETVNEGRVWLGSGLERRDRLLLASLASALLLRSDLDEHNDDL